MKVEYLSLLLIFISLNISFGQEFSDLNGDYLGQPYPGNEAVVFARGIISDRLQQHGYPTFSPDGNEVFWQTNSEKNNKWIINLYYMKKIENRWTIPEITEYGSGPAFSPDGRRLYFNSSEDGNYPFFVEKTNGKWSDSISLDLVIRYPELKFAYNLSITNKGTLYFLSYAEGFWNDFGIYRAEFIDGAYEKPEFLPPDINVPGRIRNWTPFIASDESYLLFSSTRNLPSYDQGDLHICFLKTDGNWTVPINLGKTINTKRGERFPGVSPDGKFLFFTRDTPGYSEDVYWVSADIINELKEKTISNK